MGFPGFWISFPGFLSVFLFSLRSMTFKLAFSNPQVSNFELTDDICEFLMYSCSSYNTVFSKIDFWFECKNIVFPKVKWNKLSLGMDGSVLKSTSPSKLLLIDNILRFGWSLRKSYKGFQILRARMRTPCWTWLGWIQRIF